MNQSKTLLIVGGIGATLLLGLVWWNSNKSAPSASDAVNPNAQIGAGANAQGTMPDFGNLLSYNQVPGVMSAPPATSISDWMDSSWSSADRNSGLSSLTPAGVYGA